MHRLWPTDEIPGEALAAAAPAAALQPGRGARLRRHDLRALRTRPGRHLGGVRAYTEAGFDEVYIGQVGGQLEGFFEFYAAQVLPRLRELRG